MSQHTDDSKVLHRDGDLVYTVLTPELASDALEVITESFCDEPSAVHLVSCRNSRRSQFLKFCSLFSDHCASNGDSIVCIDSTNSRVAGVFWTQDIASTPQLDDSSVDNLPCITPVIEIIDKVSEEYTTLRPNLQEGECADLWMLGVNPAYRRRGIAANLTIVARDWAVRKGYKYVILKSSGAYSAMCASKAGMKVVASAVYSEKNPIFEGIPEEHSVLRLWEVESCDVSTTSTL